jgi:hypothetical protein
VVSWLINVRACALGGLCRESARQQRNRVSAATSRLKRKAQLNSLEDENRRLRDQVSEGVPSQTTPHKAVGLGLSR